MLSVEEITIVMQVWDIVSLITLFVLLRLHEPIKDISRKEWVMLLSFSAVPLLVLIPYGAFYFLSFIIELRSNKNIRVILM